MEDTKWSMPVKPVSNFCVTNTYRCYYMLIVIWISYMGIKFRSRVFNFVIFLQSWKTHEIKDLRN